MIGWFRNLSKLREKSPKPSDGPRSLLVMHADDMALIHPEIDWSHLCSICKGKVGIYPSGQQMIATFPKMTIICNRCTTPTDSARVFAAPGALAERGTSVPNPNFK